MTTMDRTIEPRDTTGGPRTANRGQRTATVHRALAVIALLAGVLAAISGTPYRAQPIAALELAQWIRDHKPGLRIVDVRAAAAFAEYHIPRSEHLAGPLTARGGETLVIIGDPRTASGWLTANDDQRTKITEPRTANRDKRSATSENQARTS